MRYLYWRIRHWFFRRVLQCKRCWHCKVYAVLDEDVEDDGGAITVWGCMNCNAVALSPPPDPKPKDTRWEVHHTCGCKRTLERLSIRVR